MNDKGESLKFYRRAYDLSLKELGTSAYLTNTLADRIIRNQNESAPSTNPSEQDININEHNSLKIIRQKAAKSHK